MLEVGIEKEVAVMEPDMLRDPVILCASVITFPMVTPVPVTSSSVELPDVTENCVGVTLAVIEPVAILTMFPTDPVSTVMLNVELSPLVKVIVFKLTEAVVSKDPVGVDPPTPVNPLPSPINDPENWDASTDVACILYVDILYYS